MTDVANRKVKDFEDSVVCGEVASGFGDLA